MTDCEKPLIERRRRKAARIAAKKKTGFACKFLHSRSNGQRLALFEIRVTKRESLGILVLLILVVRCLAAAWLAKH